MVLTQASLTLVSKARIIILPDMLNQKEYDNAKNIGRDDDPEIDRDVIKWPKKPILPDTDLCEVDDCWHDTPLDGFSLNVSIIKKGKREKYQFCFF
jgi:RNA polymerase II-associated protein 2